MKSARLRRCPPSWTLPSSEQERRPAAQSRLEGLLFPILVLIFFESLGPWLLILLVAVAPNLCSTSHLRPPIQGQYPSQTSDGAYYAVQVWRTLGLSLRRPFLRFTKSGDVKILDGALPQVRDFLTRARQQSCRETRQALARP